MNIIEPEKRSFRRNKYSRITLYFFVVRYNFGKTVIK